MRLNKRVKSLILPVLIFSYLITFLGIYQIQKQSIIHFQSSEAKLQLNQLVANLNLYLSFADTYFPALVRSAELQNFLKIEDKRFKALAIEGNLEAAIKELDDVSIGYLSLSILSPDNQVEFYYENSDDPFSEIDPRIPEIVKKRRETFTPSARTLIKHNGSIRLVYVRFIDRYTLRQPLMKDWSKAVAVVMAFDIKGFDQLRQTLKQTTGRISELYAENQPLPVSGAMIQVSHAIPNLGSIYLEVDNKFIQELLNELYLRISVSFILLTLCSYIVLNNLIKRYITGPIQNLEHEITEVLEGHKQQPLPYKSDDEVGSLSRVFAKLYSQLHGAYEVTKEMAEKDALTKLYNRRMFTRCLERVLHRAEHNNQKVGLLYVDLDNFKFVNDKYGHETGDILLKAFATRLQDTVRTTDIVLKFYDHDLARLAGDEFAVLLHEFNKDAVLYKVAERILSLFDNGFTCEVGHFPISASIGIAIYPNDGANPTELISNSDAAMYQAKHAGKNQYAFYSQELASQARRDKEIETELKKKNFSEFEVYYMPIIDTKKNRVAGVEALLRWHSKALGFVSPAEFIPIAESRGYFEAIDLWVIQQVIHDSKTLLELFGNHLKLSINISSAQLSSQLFSEQIAKLFNQTDLTSVVFQLEITETFEIQDLTKVENNLHDLKKLGLSLAIDDFGSGYTSLVQLLNYPIDTIKIDKSLVDMMVDTRRCAMVIALIKYCKQQGFQVTAEGIEREEQASILIEAGCDYLQGFYYAKPEPLSAHIEKANSQPIIKKSS
ncbi:EAL domain-containing protein [Endozoicomonas sp. SM1973]|uniref:EAL domain-containing protein n=1 Tax=Spartinivicinus marinus TaxID=2994442 RepID=A0A853HY21_9GAMM|nr:bifunctional diguanylate cyclase/phosphodiesterase [Spartinivicinus marinus]MCX4027652.1 EAL domain-containing protein [Spartinivicinus marinus]NYZ66650.1 EAL domain-containing protein [Spartinivicinus marinus]